MLKIINKKYDIISDYLINEKNLKESSVNIYNNTLLKIIDLLPDDFDNFKNIDVTYQELKNTINTISNNTSRKNSLNVLIKLLLAYNETFLKNKNKNVLEIINLLNDDFKNFAKKVDDNRNFQKETKKEEENKNIVDGETYDEFINNHLKMYEDIFISDTLNKSNDVKYMALTLYKFLPLRSQDFCNIVIYNNKYEINEDDVDNHNYIILDEKNLVINNYKTDKSHGQRNIDLNDFLISIIIHFINKYNIRILLPSIYSNKPMSADSLGKLLKSILKISQPVQFLRKLYISEFYDNEINYSGKRYKKLAKKMGHGLSTANQIYNKNKIADGEYEDIYV